jgi:hypothetical protein
MVKPVFLVSIVLVMVIVISIILAFAPLGQKPREVASASFTCFSQTTNQTFTATAEVNLTDGVDETEAVTLASKVFDLALTVNAGYVLKSTRILNTNQTAETWKIEMERIYSSDTSSRGIQYGYTPIIQQTSWILQTTIYPNNQTVQYVTQIH